MSKEQISQEDVSLIEQIAAKWLKKFWAGKIDDQVAMESAMEDYAKERLSNLAAEYLNDCRIENQELQSISREGQEGGWVDVSVKPELKTYYDKDWDGQVTEVVINVIVTDGEEVWGSSYSESRQFDADDTVTHWIKYPSPPIKMKVSEDKIKVGDYIQSESFSRRATKVTEIDADGNYVTDECDLNDFMGSSFYVVDKNKAIKVKPPKPKIYEPR